MKNATVKLDMAIERWKGFRPGQKRFVVIGGSLMSLLFLMAFWAGTALGSWGTFEPPISWGMLALLQQLGWAATMFFIETKARKN